MFSHFLRSLELSHFCHPKCLGECLVRVICNSILFASKLKTKHSRVHLNICSRHTKWTTFSGPTLLAGKALTISFMNIHARLHPFLNNFMLVNRTKKLLVRSTSVGSDIHVNLVISKSKGIEKILRVIRSST